MLFVCLVEGKRGEAYVVDPTYKVYIRPDNHIILVPLLTLILKESFCQALSNELDIRGGLCRGGGHEVMIPLP